MDGWMDGWMDGRLVMRTAGEDRDDGCLAGEPCRGKKNSNGRRTAKEKKSYS